MKHKTMVQTTCRHCSRTLKALNPRRQPEAKIIREARRVCEHCDAEGK